jgi:hypothetical protein
METKKLIILAVIVLFAIVLFYFAFFSKKNPLAVLTVNTNADAGKVGPGSNSNVNSNTYSEPASTANNTQVFGNNTESVVGKTAWAKMDGIKVFNKANPSVSVTKNKGIWVGLVHSEVTWGGYPAYLVESGNLVVPKTSVYLT